MTTNSTCSGSNIMAIPLPTQQSVAQLNCGNQCANANLGVSDPVNKAELTPRKSREVVREQIKDYVLLMLGAPVVKIELDDQNLDAAVDLALQVFEDYCPREYFQYYVFRTNPGQSVYCMPPDVGLIRNVFYKQTGTFAFQSSDLGGALPIEYFYPGGAYASIQGGLIDPNQPMWGRMGEWVLYKQYEMMYSRLASNIGGWEWLGGLNQIKLYPAPYKVHPVIVHYLQKLKDWRQVTQAMQEGALCYAKQMLGRIRSKYSNIPSPNGGQQLDGQTLLQEAIQEKKDWMEQLVNRWGDILPITMA